MAKKVIIYHANCADGMFAAYYAWQVHRDAQLIPMYYQSQLPDLTDAQVICVDYAPTRAELEAMKPESLLIVDHHKTTFEEIQDFTPNYKYEYIYSEHHCGAWLVCEHFCGHRKPWIVEYIEDRDLWLWKLPKSHEIDACIQSFPFKLENCTMLERRGFHWCSAQGEPILRYQEKLIQKAVASAGEIEFEGFRVPSVNTSVLQSEIGAELAKGKPFAIMWWNKDNLKRFAYSLRSDPNGQDVGAICQKYGGGGHRHAASFSAPWHMEQDGPLQEAQGRIKELEEEIRDIRHGVVW